MAGHRSTLKKQNKAFKSPHSSKRAIKALNKGKIEKTAANNKAIRIQSKNERKNQKNQLKHNKITKTLELNHLFNSNKIERIITILPLTKNQSIHDIITKLLSNETDYDIINSKSNIIKIKVNKFKANLKFIIPDMDNLLAILDSCKISDFVIFGLSATEEVDPVYGEQIIRSVEAQGISTTFAVLPDVISTYPKRNLQLDVYKSLFSYYQHFFPNVEKLFMLENNNDSLNLLRNLCQKVPKGIHWRDSRGYLLADNLDKFEVDESNKILTIDGIVRGTGFNVNGLIHLPGFGDFQIEKIEKIISKSNENETIIPTEKASLNPLQDDDKDLSMDEMDDDDDDDDDDDEEEDNYGDYEDEDDVDDWNLVNKAPVIKRTRLPKGMSEYQARWMKDEEIEALIAEVGLQEPSEANGDITNDENIMEDENNNFANSGEGEDDEEIMVDDISAEEHERQLEAYRKREREELDFPDEIELRYDEIATERLNKYRGVKSLASALWDYDEVDKRRPEHWLEYLRMKNYKVHRNQLIKKYKSTTNVVAGDYVRIFVKFDNESFVKLNDPKLKPFIVYGLLPNENKLSVCNFSVQTWESYEEPIKSKESMIVQYGFRRYAINPLFSQQTRNANNVAKFQRFLHKGQVALATAIVPTSFTNSPALFFKTDEHGMNMQILCQGTFENTDFSRILAKRVVITGEVFKIHKSVVTIRFMFHNANDVNAYKNVPLFSKMGRSGFIKEALGTHGFFKAAFDGKLNAQDVIGMELFKRVWPKQGSLVPF
jgi:pre-rRNA-processing protein TSR1